MVYVGQMFVCVRTKKWKYQKAAHMFCEPPPGPVRCLDLTELHEMANKIGLRPVCFQNHATVPHYDLTEGKRWQAIRAGASEATTEQELEIIQKWREFDKKRLEIER